MTTLWAGSALVNVISAPGQICISVNNRPFQQVVGGGIAYQSSFKLASFTTFA